MKKIRPSTFKTRSYTYIFPMLGNNYMEFPAGVINCYIGDTSNPKRRDKIYLLLNHKTEAKRDRDTQILEIDANYVEHYTVDEDNTMFVYDIPPKWKPAYYLFIAGKYSKFMDLYKRQILNFHGLSLNGDVGKVLYRKEELYVQWEKALDTSISRLQEIGSMPNLDLHETFDKKMIISKNKIDVF